MGWGRNLLNWLCCWESLRWSRTLCRAAGGLPCAAGAWAWLLRAARASAAVPGRARWHPLGLPGAVVTAAQGSGLLEEESRLACGLQMAGVCWLGGEALSLLSLRAARGLL